MATQLKAPTDSELALLRVLSERVPAGPNYIGTLVWGRYSGTSRALSRSSAPYARSAGKILKRLRELGYAQRVAPRLDWVRTREGTAAIKTWSCPAKLRPSTRARGYRSFDVTACVRARGHKGAHLNEELTTWKT